MTDTTDIKALSYRMMQQREAALTGNTPSFEDCELLVCDLLRALTLSNKKLEAERQQREAAEKEREGLQKALVIYGDEILELRSKLANPVVLHSERFDYQETDEYEVGYVRGFNASRMESIADIGKAGFTVKEAV